MADKTQVRQHRWTEMSYTDVEVIGVDDKGIPVCVAAINGTHHRGVACLACGLPFEDAGSIDEECEGGVGDVFTE